MKFILQEGDMISLDNDETYRVFASVDYKNEEYAIVYKIPEKVAELLDADKMEVMTVKVHIENDEAYVEEVEDKELCKKINKKRITQKKKLGI